VQNCLERAISRWHQKVDGGTSYAVAEVPRALRGVMGKKRLITSLRTDSLDEAVKRKHAVLAEFNRQFEAARRGGLADDAASSAMAWRDLLTALPPGPDRDRAIYGLGEEIDERVGPGAAFGDDPSGRGAEFQGVALGSRAPVTLYQDRWLSEGNKRKLRPVTVENYKRRMAAITDYLQRQGITTIEAVTRRAAGKVVSDMLGEGLLASTVNSTMVAPAAYWRWLQRRGLLPEGAENPWRGQNVEAGEPERRAFSDSEVRAMLSRAKGDTADILQVLLLSGLRIGELCRLRVRDCANSWFRVQGKGGRDRRVPVHSRLTATIARRTEGRGPDAPLFPGRRGGHREPRATSAIFGRKLRRWGIAVEHDDRRQTSVTLHSTRKWFTDQMLRAGSAPYVAADVLGHAHRLITLRTYASGASAAQLIAAVEAVKLPEPVQARCRSVTT
jgi:integrase